MDIETWTFSRKIGLTIFVYLQCNMQTKKLRVSWFCRHYLDLFLRNWLLCRTSTSSFVFGFSLPTPFKWYSFQASDNRSLYEVWWKFRSLGKPKQRNRSIEKTHIQHTHKHTQIYIYILYIFQEFTSLFSPFLFVNRWFLRLTLTYTRY